MENSSATPTRTKRLEQLEKLLARTPDDPFLLYGIAMEYKNGKDAPRAIEYFTKVIERDAGYCYAYHQQGLTHEMTGDVEAARRAYRAGIQAAQRKGDAHAAGEIEAALAQLE